MSKLTEAVDNIKRLSVMFKGMIELADELDKVSSIENHIQELEAAKVLILKENETLRAENDQIIESINVNNQRAQDIISEAYNKQEQMVLETEKMCDTRSENNKRIIDGLAESFEIEKNQILLNLENAKSELTGLKSQIEEHQVTLKDLKEAIASIKEKF
jgi:hypothetical protein